MALVEAVPGAIANPPVCVAVVVPDPEAIKNAPAPLALNVTFTLGTAANVIGNVLLVAAI